MIDPLVDEELIDSRTQANNLLDSVAVARLIERVFDLLAAARGRARRGFVAP